MKKAQKEANTDASVAVSTAVSERACVCKHSWLTKALSVYWKNPTAEFL